MEGKEEQKNAEKLLQCKSDGDGSNINDDFGKDIQDISTPVDEMISEKPLQCKSDGDSSNINDDFGKDIEDICSTVDEIISDDYSTNEDSSDEDCVVVRHEHTKAAGRSNIFGSFMRAASVKKDDVGIPQTYDLYETAEEIDDSDDGSRNEESSDEKNVDIRHKLDQFRAAGGFDAFESSLRNAESEEEDIDNVSCEMNKLRTTGGFDDDFFKDTDSIDEDGNNVFHKYFKMGNTFEFYKFGSQVRNLQSTKEIDFFKRAFRHKNIIGNTPLLELLRSVDMDCCNREALKILLQKVYEYDVNTSNNLKLGPLHMIMSKEFVSNIYQDISSTSDQKLLDSYNKKRNKIAEMLLKAGANVNQKDIFDRTPVFFANATSSVKLLIKEGADLNITDKFGRSVLLAAVSMENHKKLTQYYIKTMKFLKPDECQSTVFHYVAILQRELDIFDNFEGKFVKCDYLECKDRNGKTPYDVSRFKLQSEVNKKFKHSLLKQRGVGAPWDDKESELIKRTVINFAEELCKAIGEKDKRLICTLQRSGSSEEGTKIGDLNEFDFIFCMGEIQKLCTVDDVNIEEEFVTINANKDIPQTFTVFFNSEGRCKISEVRLAFSRAVKTIVLDEHIWKSKDIIFGKLKNSEESDKPVVTLEIRWFGCAYKDEIISIDLVPAIRKTEWWPTKGGRCELLNQNDRIKDKGCLLLFQTKYFVQSETLMRISCSPVETELLKNVLPPYFLEGYRHCKLIYLWLVNNHSSNIHIQNCIKHNLLTSYMFKNCLFYVYENYKMEEKPVTPENSEVAAIELVDDILSCLQSFNEKCTFPVYVIPEREDIFVIKSFKQYNLREDSKTITTHHCKTREHVIKYMQEIHSGEKF